MSYYVLIEDSEGIDIVKDKTLFVQQIYYQSNVFHVVFFTSLQRILNRKEISAMVAFIV